MKKIFSLFLLISALIAFSCSDNATGPGGGGGLGGGGNGGGAVTFTMGTTAGQQQDTKVFTFKPSTSVTITTLTVKYPAQPFEDVLTNPDPTTVFNSQTVYSTGGDNGVGEYTGVQPGQKWQFVFVGKIGSTTGTDYNVTVDWTIP